MTDTVGRIITENYSPDSPDTIKTEMTRRLDAATKQTQEEIYRGRMPSMNFLLGSGALALGYYWHLTGVAGDFEEDE